MYQLTHTDSILRLSDGAYIPLSEGNADYQSYLEWCAQGNAPLPASPLPAQQVSCTPYQIRQALTLAGLRGAVETAVQAGSQELKDAWAYAQTFERNNQKVIELGQALGQTDAQLDALFALAQTLSP